MTPSGKMTSSTKNQELFLVNYSYAGLDYPLYDCANLLYSVWIESGWEDFPELRWDPDGLSNVVISRFMEYYYDEERDEYPEGF